MGVSLGFPFWISFAVAPASWLDDSAGGASGEGLVGAGVDACDESPVVGACDESPVLGACDDGAARCWFATRQQSVIRQSVLSKGEHSVWRFLSENAVLVMSRSALPQSQRGKTRGGPRTTSDMVHA